MDRDQIEAARVDGAGNWPVLRGSHRAAPETCPACRHRAGHDRQTCSSSTRSIALTGGGPRPPGPLSCRSRSTAALLSPGIWGWRPAVGVLWVCTILPPAYFYLRQLMKGAD